MSAKYTLLLTNDDGIEGEGLHALEQALSQVADVYVLAPATNRSAVSSALTMNKPSRVTQVGPRCYTLDANPTDCVIAACRSDLFAGVHFDAVFSGINRGPNLGTDTVYSGTVAAARQAAIYGIPGIALSLDSLDGTWKYDALAAFAARNVQQLIEFCKQHTNPQGVIDAFVNVNAASADSYKKLCYCSLSKRVYKDSVAIISAPDKHTYGFFVGGDLHTEGDESCDYKAVAAGNIAVSLIQAEAFVEPKPEHFSFLL